MRKTSRLLAFCSLLLSVAPSGLYGQDTPDAEIIGTSMGVYTAEQAKTGGEVFEAVCFACHDAEEFESIVEGWEGESAYDLFDQLRNTMPEDAPGSLRTKEYVAIVAYLLELNGVPTGTEELGTDTDLLKRVVLEVPESSSGGAPLR